MKKINKKTLIVISSVILIIIIRYYFTKEKSYTYENFNISQENIQKENEIDATEIDENKEKNKIMIHIAGAIKKEGVYQINEGSRIIDAIEISGGTTEDADTTNINLAYLLEDGMKIYIPKIDEKNNVIDETKEYIFTDNNVNNSAKNNKNNIVNINTATQTELETLPGIGPSLALKIIQYRTENGKFNSIDEIRKVSGIGESKYKKIKELIKV